MKQHVLTCLFLCLGASSLLAQNDLFLPLPYAYHQAYARLNALDYVHFVEEVPDRRLCIEAQAARFTYEFLGGWLYRETMVRTFDTRRQARKAYKGVKAFFETVGIPPQKDTGHHFIGLDEGQVYDLHLQPGPKAQYELHLSKRHPVFTPMMEWTSLDAELVRAWYRR
ncbi:MAG: hypothetical protein D6722_23385 [Bacteroidetes bacterium]|nr:MAG: hypothetical protein D6722_23385 [Bacteroidota bacterium]